jgi:hypothetical protein
VFYAPLAHYCIPWAMGVAWSRVAKGRHFPLDVIVGAIVGTMLGYFVEEYCSGYERAAIKIIAGVFATSNWVYYMFIPLFDGQHKVLLFSALAFFFFFAGNLFFSSVSISRDVAGAQSIDTMYSMQEGADGDGEAYTCKRFW